MADTLDDLLEQWRIHGGWKPSKADFGRLVDEIDQQRALIDQLRADAGPVLDLVRSQADEIERLRGEFRDVGADLMTWWDEGYPPDPDGMERLRATLVSMRPTDA